MANSLESPSLQQSTPTSDASSPSVAAGQQRKRPSEAPSNGRKTPKVSRACDHCKSKKLKCTGTIPCRGCSTRGIVCEFNAQYRRGRPPTPPAAVGAAEETPSRGSGETTSEAAPANAATNNHDRSRSSNTSRASPGFASAEIGGQIVDSTSNLSFIHRAWKRLALQKRDTRPDVLTGLENSQPLVSAGDKPFIGNHDQQTIPMDRESTIQSFNFYFENCVVTYRILHRQTCFQWLGTVVENFQNNVPLQTNIGHARAAVVIGVLAIADLRQYKLSVSDVSSLERSERYFTTSLRLTAEETGLPRVESAQARVLQVLYLLQTSRMNQAWYVFGNTIPIVSALGLHRKAVRHRVGGSLSPTVDYITMECCKRTFWVVYTIDKYLAVVFGRPRFYHGDDVDQDYPDRVNDEDMTCQGPTLSEPLVDCHVDSLIFHARIARIIESISREVYSLKPMSNQDRLAAAQDFTREIHDWHKELPPHLGSVRPLSLIPSFARQGTALKLAYCHAIIHANRPFLLESSSGIDQASLDACVSECLAAAKMALETVDRMFSNGHALFFALWWIPYITFCALAIVYVWEIKQKANGETGMDDPLLFRLAEQCQAHLATTLGIESASHRYSVIIEELRVGAKYDASFGASHMITSQSRQEHAPGDMDVGQSLDSMTENLASIFEDPSESRSNPLQWQPTDWLDLDSSAFGFFSELDSGLIL